MRCKEAYKKYTEALETKEEVCEIKRGKRVGYQIEAHDKLVCTIVQRNVPEDAIYCNFSQQASRPIIAEKDGEIREAAIDIITERCQNNIRTTEGDAKQILRQLKNKPQKVVQKQPPDGIYNVILADPPWKYEQYSAKPSNAIENYYPTMDLNDIKKLPKTLSKRYNIEIDKDSILFLWATAPKLEEAIGVLNEWGFSYRSCAIWDKENLGLGYYFRVQHELLLVGKKGGMSTPGESDRPRSVIRAKSTRHSEKPTIVHELIEKMYPTGRRIELFARKEREGWAVWGDEIELINKRRDNWDSGTWGGTVV